jgi:acyl-CoA dehydrogenase family member 9
MSQDRPSFIRQLFSGSIDDDLLFPFPSIEGEEHARVEELLSRVAAYLDEHLDPAAVDEAEHIPQETIDGLKEIGLFGVGIPTR